MEMEEAFSLFLDSEEYDRAQDSLFVLARRAFRAGWQAAEQAVAGLQLVEHGGEGREKKGERGGLQEKKGEKG